MALLVALSIFIVGASADPQFGLLPKSPAIPVPAPPAAIPGVGDALEWSTKIKDLVDLTQTALTEMGQIAVDDNPEVGAKIVVKLNEQIAKAVKIFADFSAKSLRVRRDAKENGDAAFNDVGGVLVESNDKTQPEKGELSPEAQEKMDSRHDKAVDDCKADVCKSHREKRKKIAAAKAAKG